MSGPETPGPPDDPPDASGAADPSDAPESPGAGTTAGSPPEDAPRDRRPPALTAVGLLRWAWRRLTSMRTALVLLLLLAVAAVPGSLVPQEDVDALAASRWRDAHPDLTPIYERLGLFSVYDTAWFAAIYLLLMVSLVGCFIPRLRVYWRGLRAAPPPAPRHLSRIGEHRAYTTTASPEAVLSSAQQVLRGRRFRVAARSESVSAERGYLREAGNLVFHFSVLVVLVGFAASSLLGFRGGVILVVGNGFANNITQYDDFVPGALFDSDEMQPFTFQVTDFDATWLREGPAAGQAREFSAQVSYSAEPGGEERNYDLRVNHPLDIGGTEVFLIGHGYAPVITVRDGQGEVAYSGPTTFLPTNSDFRSFGVVKAPDAQPTGIGLEGEFYPTYAFTEQGGPFSAFGNTLNPAISMVVWKGDLGLDDGSPQSVYSLDKEQASRVTKPDGSPVRLDMRPGQTEQLPGGLGSVTFERVERWNKVQISRTPGKFVALAGVVLALLGLIGSLYVRPRRVWVRASPDPAGGARVEVAALDRTDGGDVAAELDAVVAGLQEHEEDQT